MKKILALILVTVMIAVMIPIVSVAAPDPDTWFYDGDNSVFVGVMGYWVWPDAGFASELNVNFTTPNAFSGVKFMPTGDASVNVELYGMHDRKGGSVVHAVEGTGPVEVDFGTVNAPGNYTIKITYVSGAHFAVPIGHANPAMPVTCDVYPSNAAENGITDPAPAMWLTGAEYTGPAPDADQWLGDKAGLNFGYGMTTDPVNQYFDIIFDSPKTFGGFSAFFYVANSVADIKLLDATGATLETIPSYAFTASDNVYTFFFSKAYNPGHYKIRIAMVSANPHLLIGGTDNPGDIPVIVNGAFVAAYGHPYPYFKLIGDFSETIKQPLYGGTPEANADPGKGWWFNKNAADTLATYGKEREIVISFTSDIWFNKLMMGVRGKGNVNLELSTAAGTVVDNIAFVSPLGDTDYAFAYLTRSHAPGNYILKITAGSSLTDDTNDPNNYFVLAEGSVNTDPRVSVAANVFRAASTTSPAITLMGENQPELGLTKINVSLTDGNLISLNFKADNALFLDSDNGSTVVTFTVDGVSTDVEGVVKGDQRVFTLSGLSPEEITKTVVAVLKTKVGGVEMAAPAYYYVPETYFENLEISGAHNLQSLAAATLNYAAAAQAFKGENVTIAAGDASHLPAVRVYTDAKSLTAISAAEKKASWKAVGLKLEDEVMIRYTFTLDAAVDPTDVTVQFTYDGALKKTLSIADCTATATAGRYICYLPMPANKLSTEVTAQIFEGATGISSALVYSVESYAAAKQNGGDALADLVKAMMQYGDAAAAYVADPNN